MSSEKMITGILVLGMLLPFVLSVFCPGRGVRLFFRIVCVLFLVLSLVSVVLSMVNYVFHLF